VSVSNLWSTQLRDQQSQLKNGKFDLTTRRSETPENIEAKLGMIDYLTDPYNLVNFCGNRSNGVCSPYCWNIAYLWLFVPFLSFPSLFFLSPTAKTGGRIFTMYTLKNDAGFAQRCAFWGSRLRKIMFGLKTPKKVNVGDWNIRFKLNLQFRPVRYSASFGLTYDLERTLMTLSRGLPKDVRSCSCSNCCSSLML